MKYLIVILLFLVSCQKEEKDGIEYRVFKISKHYSHHGIKTFKNHSISGSAIFDSSCEYEIDENTSKLQINKLVGLSNGPNSVHDNSIRIGWTYLPEKDHYELYAYWYHNGERDHQFITTVESNEPFSYSVIISEHSYMVSINSEMAMIDVELGELKTSYMLYPYFGGSAPFPGSIHGNDKCKIYLKY